MPASSLRALLRNVVDYAGFFPPADLPLQTAIRNYAEYRRADDAWMLGRFVCKAGQLAELDAERALFDQDAPFRFSVLAGRGDDPAAFLRALERDVNLAAQFLARHAGAVRVDAFEMHLPSDLLSSDTATLNGFLRDVQDLAENAELERPAFFLEIPLDEHISRHASLVAGAVAGRNDAAAFGLKLRCGGATPADHPAPHRLAEAVTVALQQDVPFKATAGLHHPFRHHDEPAGTAMHGFVNVFGGAALAVEHDLSASDYQRLLEDDAPESFTFSGETLHWQNLAASVGTIRRVRRSLALSFGSCSFDDPRRDLRSAGLL